MCILAGKLREDDHVTLEAGTTANSDGSIAHRTFDDCAAGQRELTTHHSARDFAFDTDVLTYHVALVLAGATDVDGVRLD